PGRDGRRGEDAREEGGRRTPRRKGRPAIAPGRAGAGSARQDRSSRPASGTLRSPSRSASREDVEAVKGRPPAGESFESRAPFVPPGMEEQGQASRAASVHPGFDRLRALASQARKGSSRTRDEDAGPSRGGRGGNGGGEGRNGRTSRIIRCPAGSPAQGDGGDPDAAFVRLAGAEAAHVGRGGQVIPDRLLERSGAVAVHDECVALSGAQALVEAG